jgi:putative lipoprotein
MRTPVGDRGTLGPMRTLVVVLAALAATPAQAQVDPWLGPDKALHFGASAALTGAGYAVGVTLTASRPLRLVLGVSLGVAAGVGKELYDAAGGGDPSARDLAWDALGVVTGALVAYAIDRLVSDDSPTRTSSSTLALMP